MLRYGRLSTHRPKRPSERATRWLLDLGATPPPRCYGAGVLPRSDATRIATRGPGDTGTPAKPPRCARSARTPRSCNASREVVLGGLRSSAVVAELQLHAEVTLPQHCDRFLKLVLRRRGHTHLVRLDRRLDFLELRVL